MRAELFSVSQLERHARTLAGWHELSTSRQHDDWLLARLTENEAALRDAVILITQAVQNGRQITPAAEWFIDNYHLVEDQVRTARLHLPREYNRELPRLANGPTPGTPRVYHIALELISHAHGRVDIDGLRAFIASYQTIQPLRLGELWAIPIMLRLALLENMRRVVAGVTAGRSDRESAIAWAMKMQNMAQTSPTDVVLVLADLVEADPLLTDPFVAELATRLQAQGSALALPMSWLEQRLSDDNRTLERVFEQVSQSQAADQVSIGNTIGSLRMLGATDWRDFVEAMSVVERTLRTDATYGEMDFATRDRYRHVVEALAKRSDRSEDDVARAAIRLTRDRSGRMGHVGWALVDNGRAELEKAVHARTSLALRIRRASAKFRHSVYFGSILGLTIAIAIGLDAMDALPTTWWWIALLCVCATAPAITIVHWAATILVRPCVLPRLDFSAGIPASHKTLVAVPALLTDFAEIDELVESVEVRFLANRDPNLAFALVTDFRDATSEETDKDSELLDHVIAGIRALDEKYPNNAGFYLFHRARTWNARDKIWMGWERKRGKLEQLNLALRGDTSSFHTIVGPMDRLGRIDYVIALDADTDLPREVARELTATLSHPLNRPCFDERKGRVTEGYAILQPRVGASMTSVTRTHYASLFGGQAGIDPYTRAVSDVYQDVFGEGSFIGKGIYDVDAMQRALGGRLPDNRILSHDLLEGAYARSAMVSDVLLIEDFPASHAVDISRRHRWTRGDWQILPWLFRRVPGPEKSVANPISGLSQWKVLDNLRRSVVPVAMTSLLVVGWLLGAAWFATFAVIGMFALPTLITNLGALSQRPIDRPRRQHGYDVLGNLVRALARDGFTIACLPYDAIQSLDAIWRAMTRVLLTRRRLLEWRTASDAHRMNHVHVMSSLVTMWIGPVASIAIFALVPQARIPALPIAALWIASPIWSWWLSRPIVPVGPRLREDERRELFRIARRTWRFFETFVVEDDSFLPPDNFQEDPPRGIAHRTSPTNIGLSLLANLGAWDFGYISGGDLIARTERTFGSLAKMQRFRGHFYNWYDTKTLEPLLPKYVSSVDSGNMAADLLTLANGFDEVIHHPARPQLRGLGDTLDVLHDLSLDWPEVARLCDHARTELAGNPTASRDVAAMLARVATVASELVAAVGARDSDDVSWWAKAFAAHVEQLTADLVDLAPWLELSGDFPIELDQPMSLVQLARLDVELPMPDARAELRAAIATAAERAVARITKLRDLAQTSRELADIDYEPLYDRERNLLSIGYVVNDHKIDASRYDLLASEARLASFVAIAEGKLPQEHWFSLGRQLTTSRGLPALVSWSGSMFEYLMPLLVMPSYANTLLDETYRAVVQRQIDYGKQRGVPWGVSESGYNVTDVQRDYQYRAFGVPGLGFKRGLGDDLVIAPYATGLALMVEPRAAIENLQALERIGALGPCGFYEAIDFTPGRVPAGSDHAVVKSYMAHHQGMVLLSIASTLLDEPMQRRFAAAPSFKATELLLQERVPKVHAIFPHPPEVASAITLVAGGGPDLRVLTTPNTPIPEVHLQSNGRYSLAITNAGGGYSRWRDIAVTRWREDATRDCWGTFGYLRDVTPAPKDGSVVAGPRAASAWSITHQPTLTRGTSYEVIFSQARAEFKRVDHEIATHVEISVSPEDDIELRRISLTNRGKTARTIELTSYAEVVIAGASSDAAHPAFSNLFVQTEIIRVQQAIVCSRRPRSANEKPPWMVHLAAVHGTTTGSVSYETSRAAFIGRGRTVVDPIAMHRDVLSDSEGAVLDPIVAIRVCVVLEPDETARIHLVTGMAETRADAIGLVDKYRDDHAADRVFELAWTHNQVLDRRLDITNSEARVFDKLASNVVFATPILRAPSSVIARNKGAQSGLWAYGISGDLPIVLVRVTDTSHVDFVRHLVKAHAYWRLKGLQSDLVVWNEDPTGYRQVLQEQIMSSVAAVSDANLLDRPGGIFVRRSDQIPDDDKILMQTVARLIVTDTAGSLADQVDRIPRPELPQSPIVPRISRKTTLALPDPSERELDKIERPDLVEFNGIGGFTSDGREYVITTSPTLRTPAPWCNVIANAWFGTVVSESGSAYTWCENAHEYRLTPWHNDWVTDPSGESYYLRDEDDGKVWSPTPLPVTAPARYTTRHGFGYSVFEVVANGIASELYTYVAADAPIKFCVIKIRNRSGRARKVSLTGVYELVLGESRDKNLMHVVSELDPKTGGLFARNAYSSEFGARVAFLDCSEDHRTFAGDRGEIIGRNGTMARPACMQRGQLSGRVGAGLDPCLAMRVMIDLADNEEREIAFTFGSGRDLADARALVTRFRGTEPARVALEGVWAYWNKTLGTVNVQTPDPAVNFLANGWLLYQVIASRLWARSGFYQSGGAFGFRDQLQDAMALVHADPGLLREQIVKAASRQFGDGDVQHWWHPPVGRGVRTHISDDYLFLPLAVCRYVTALGDTGVLDEPVHFLDGRPVKPEEDSYYDLPARSEQAATIYEHCVRAIRHGLRMGEHGLPLMGTGDWNDGMNLVGEHGKGESVWLGFFLYDVLQQFTHLARLRGDSAFADTCTAEAQRLRTALDEHAWDGDWYLRAYFDDGTLLGSATNDDCQIDSLPQSWSILSGAGEPAKVERALASMDRRLVDRDLRLVKVLDPPFDKSKLEPGYIKGYIPGVRENGGQYTHAAVWAAMAFAASGDTAKAWEVFGLIDPIHHGNTAETIAVYKVEPYVVAADVYTNPQHPGRGGWTWYTGSAGWMYRLVVESLLGIKLEADHLRIEPKIPTSWPEMQVHYRFRETVYHLRVVNHGGSVTRVVCDGEPQRDLRVPLVDDHRDHRVDIELG